MKVKVKLTTVFPEWPTERQTPGNSAVWGDFHFFVDQPVKECDYWVVYDGLIEAEEVFCPKENIFFISAEPPTLRTYNSKYLEQFSTIVTCHTDVKHKNVILQQQALPWHVGRRQNNHRNISFSKNYDELKSFQTINKTKDLSVISSDKGCSDGHRKRVSFLKKLQEHFDDRIDVFGRGINEIEDKWDAISKYKYHIVIENSAIENYWTEKLSDAFLGMSYPFYHGCSNLQDYFSEKAYTNIYIDDFGRTVEIIEKAIAEQIYAKSFDNIIAARNMILDKYNLFPMICELCNQNGFMFSEKKKNVLLPEKEIKRAKNINSFIGKFINVLIKTINQ